MGIKRTPLLRNGPEEKGRVDTGHADEQPGGGEVCQRAILAGERRSEAGPT